MIKVIYGAKGTGKTKQMIDAANEAVKTAKGHLVFITDTKRGMYDLEREVRFIDVTDFDVAGEAALLFKAGFAEVRVCWAKSNTAVLLATK